MPLVGVALPARPRSGHTPNVRDPEPDCGGGLMTVPGLSPEARAIQADCPLRFPGTNDGFNLSWWKNHVSAAPRDFAGALAGPPGRVSEGQKRKVPLYRIFPAAISCEAGDLSA